MISRDELLQCIDETLDGLVRCVEQLGDELANQRLSAAGSNTPYAILTHCLGVMEYWGGLAIAGRTITRDRPAEFRASGRVAELLPKVEQSREQLRRDLRALDPFAPPRGALPTDVTGLPLGRTQGGALVHIYEELCQHLGQLEITRDVLLAQAGAAN